MTGKPIEHAAEVDEYLSFRVGEHVFCVDIMSVREIRSWSSATSLPHTPDYVRGVINLRGIVLPIIDLAQRLDLAAETENPRSVVIVVNDEETDCGLLVDAVCDILPLPPDRFQPPPELRTSTTGQFIDSLVAEDDGMIRMLNLRRTIAADQADPV